MIGGVNVWWCERLVMWACGNFPYTPESTRCNGFSSGGSTVSCTVEYTPSANASAPFVEVRLGGRDINGVLCVYWLVGWLVVVSVYWLVGRGVVFVVIFAFAGAREVWRCVGHAAHP